MNAVALNGRLLHFAVYFSGIEYKLGISSFSQDEESIRIKYLIDGILFFNSFALSMYVLETSITVGSQFERIECNSKIVNLLSNGTVVKPANTEPKTQAPYSGFDSDKIANFSPFSICKSSIKYDARRLDNNPNPL